MKNVAPSIASYGDGPHRDLVEHYKKRHMFEIQPGVPFTSSQRHSVQSVARVA